MNKLTAIYIASTLFLAGCCCDKTCSSRCQKPVESHVKNNQPLPETPETTEVQTKSDIQPNQQEVSQTMSKVKTDSGLEYEIITAGKGATPSTGHTVTVHYTGWLNEDGQPGTKFDSSLDRHQPFKFVIGIGHVIPGWDEGVMGMQVGETRRLYIPSELGYGARGAGRSIPPHSDLIFDVELIDTK